MSTRIQTEIVIQAAPSVVWQALMDFAAYPAWNPFILELSGKPVVGTRLRARIRPEGSSGMVFTPMVLVAEPDRAFRWRGSLFVPGLMDGEHSFVLEPCDDGSTRFRHEEAFTGILVPLFQRMMETGSRAGFEAMNRALKERAERIASGAGV